MVLSGGGIILGGGCSRPLWAQPWYVRWYLNVPVGLPENSLVEQRAVERVQEVHVEVVEVGLNGDPLHHQVLRHPLIVLLSKQTMELLNLHA